jgi:alkylhydroperoxidase family enzyme
VYEELLPKLDGRLPLDAREAAALDFAERFATDHTSIDDPFVARLRAVFSDAELVELGLITGAFVVLGRLHRTFSVAPMGPRSHAVLSGGAPADKE